MSFGLLNPFIFLYSQRIWCRICFIWWPPEAEWLCDNCMHTEWTN